MIYKFRRDKHVMALCAAHGVGPKRLRTLLRFNVLPALGEPTGFLHKRPDETVTDTFQRVLEKGPRFGGREDFERLRAQMVATQVMIHVTLPDERLREITQILEAEGKPVIFDTVFAMAGGNRPAIVASLRRLHPERTGNLERDIMVAAELELYHLDAFRRSGLMPELDQSAQDERTSVDPDAVAGDLRRRFAEWQPARFEFQQIKDLSVMRHALRLVWTEGNPEGVFDPAFDFMLRHGQTPRVDTVQAIIGGNAEQTGKELTRRSRASNDVPLPQRRNQKGTGLEEMRLALPAEAQNLFNTALDSTRGTSRDSIPPHQMDRIVRNPHPQLQVIGAVVALHGRKHAALKRKAEKAERAAGHLGPSLIGIDVHNPAQLATGFEAIRLIMRSSPDRSDVHRVNRDIDNFRFVLEIFDDYARQPGRPHDEIDFLNTLRPVQPSGGDDLFKEIRLELDAFKRESKSDLERNLQPFVADAPAFIGRVLDQQATLAAFRKQVHAKTAANKAKGAKARWPLRDTFTMRQRQSSGEIADFVCDYQVHTWPDVMARINAVTDAYTRDKRQADQNNCFNSHPGDDALFENRYVVELLGCTRDGQPADYPLDVLRLHRDYGFWRPRDLPDADAYALQGQRHVELGLNRTVIESLGAGIGNFARGKFGRARRARMLFGMVLIPLEEMHHSALIGAVHISTRSVQALRIGDLEQWNVGSGLETSYDAEGKPFSIMTSMSKYQREERRSPLTKESEALTEQLLDANSNRFFEGGTIPVMKRANPNGRGSESERMVFCTRTAGMPGFMINNHSRLLMGGNGGFKSHYAKYIWSTLSRLAGESLEQRREGHGHTDAKMTSYYDVLTPEEKAQLVCTLHEQVQFRSSWMRGERATPLPDPPLQTLLFQRRRLENDLTFLEGEASPDVSERREELSRLDARIRRARERA